MVAKETVQRRKRRQGRQIWQGRGQGEFACGCRFFASSTSCAASFGGAGYGDFQSCGSPVSDDRGVGSLCSRVRSEGAAVTGTPSVCWMRGSIRAFDPELEPDFSAGLKHSSDDSELVELA